MLNKWFSLIWIINKFDVLTKSLSSFAETWLTLAYWIVSTNHKGDTEWAVSKKLRDSKYDIESYYL